MQNYDQLKNEILENINNASNLDELEKVRVTSIGKKGKLSVLMKKLGSLEPSKRKETGQKLNLIQKDIIASIENKRNVLGKQQFPLIETSAWDFLR